jgi:hypothetical protein
MKIAALISVLLLLVMLSVIISSDSQNAHISISERAASRKWSYLLFACSLTFFGSLLLLYLLRYFGSQFGLPVSYYIALLIAWASLLLTAWIPDHGPRSFTNPHWRSALGLAGGITVMTMSLAFAQHVDTVMRILSIIISIWYCYTLYVWLFNTKAYELYLRFETMNIASFVGLLALTLIFR